jgi:peptidoglycan/xylan/chitin deacetylase (PgdA/CDA1 family)
LGEVVAQGHELGCHTFDHCHAWDIHPKLFEDSILRNRQALSRLLPGASFPTLSYPLGIPRPQSKQKVEKYFLACRGCSQTLNSGVTDLNFLKAFFLEQRRSDASVKALIDRNCECNGWLIFATHDIAGNPSRFGCTPAFFKEIVRYAAASGANVLPVAAALKRICGQEA